MQRIWFSFFLTIAKSIFICFKCLTVNFCAQLMIELFAPLLNYRCMFSKTYKIIINIIQIENGRQRPYCGRTTANKKTAICVSQILINVLSHRTKSLWWRRSTASHGHAFVLTAWLLPEIIGWLITPHWRIFNEDARLLKVPFFRFRTSPIFSVTGFPTRTVCKS